MADVRIRPAGADGWLIMIGGDSSVLGGLPSRKQAEAYAADIRRALDCLAGMG